MLKMFNSLTEKVELLSPLDGRVMRLYGCGVTVYDHCHLGHGRVFVLYDLMVRTLKKQGQRVFAARNVTDIDDKILQKALDTGLSWNSIAHIYTESMQTVLKNLGCLEPQIEPKATDSIASMIEMIEQLIANGHAYEVDGEVLFHVESFPQYGALSKQKLEHLHHGSRVSVDDRKKHPCDFTLWKASKEGEPAWESPWGLGRPGWHIECSAMIHAVFGQTIDVHLGGADLKFPHHENEIAQSEGCFHRPLATHWVHGGFVTVDDVKMSKSLGNFHYLHDLLDEVGMNAVRYFYLTTHYRQPLAFTALKLDQAKRSWDSLNKTLSKHLVKQELPSNTTIEASLMEALSDDLNTPECLSRLHHLVKELDHLPTAQANINALSIAKWLAEVLGLVVELKREQPSCWPAEVEALLQQRAQARAHKDYALSDRLRETLRAQGYDVKDTAQGQECFKL